MGCGTCVKVLVIITNILLALASLALTGVGVSVLLDLHDNAPTPVIVVGAVTFVVSILGCCGAFMDNKYILFIYSILLIVLMNLKTAMATLTFMVIAIIKAVAVNILEMLFRTKPESIPVIQKALKCCGTTGAQSYPSLELPATCCKEEVCTIANAYRGCDVALVDYVIKYSLGIAACCIVLVCIELIAVIFGLCLANHASNKQKSRY